MNKRETALEIIRIEYAKYGKETRESMRAYVENRISSKTRDNAIRSGLLTYRMNEKVLSIWNENEGSIDK